jgi:hypothetical protein
MYCLGKAILRCKRRQRRCVRQEEAEKMREEAEPLDNGAIEIRARKRARNRRSSVRAYTTSLSN